MSGLGFGFFLFRGKRVTRLLCLLLVNPQYPSQVTRRSGPIVAPWHGALTGLFYTSWHNPVSSEPLCKWLHHLPCSCSSPGRGGAVLPPWGSLPMPNRKAPPAWAGQQPMWWATQQATVPSRLHLSLFLYRLEISEGWGVILFLIQSIN